MNDGISYTSLMQTAPQVLREDENLRPLVQMVAEALSNLIPTLQYPRLYSRIDELPEWLLDVLAKDFNITWYDYDSTVEVKRNAIRSSFDVHRHMATKGAFLKAISDVYPQSNVAEWFEYGGDPSCVCVVINRTQTLMTFNWTDMLRAISMYKPARANVDEVTLQADCNVTVQTYSSSFMYSFPRCGTFRCGER